jgi:hypothetical protein
MVNVKSALHYICRYEIRRKMLSLNDDFGVGLRGRSCGDWGGDSARFVLSDYRIVEMIIWDLRNKWIAC